MQLTASRRGQPIPNDIQCHSNCLVFACPGCIENVSSILTRSDLRADEFQDRSSYQILNLKNDIYDYHCSSCMEEEPPSRRGSVENEFGRIAGLREAIC